MKNKEEIVVFWFRRDLRLEDNVALYYALQTQYKVLPIFIFDSDILKQFDNLTDKRISYIHQAITALNVGLSNYKSGVKCFHSTALGAFSEVLEHYDVKAVYSNEDYEPQAIRRDREIATMLCNRNIHWHSYKDQVIFKGGELLKKDGTAYKVYTPYAKQWKQRLTEQQLYDYTPLLEEEGLCILHSDLPSLAALGYKDNEGLFNLPAVDTAIVANYDKYRDFPGIEGTTKIGVALRFGTVSIRHCVRIALKENEVWLSELIWRDFFSQILYLYPQVETNCFKAKYEGIKYRNNEEDFKAWCLGQTGYPIVDAGMRELNATGFMHNRVRMVVASFLTKHLLIDWRWGEAYFAQQLLDYDLASNNGNWQWVAGCGCDAAPYFRVFNPTEQVKKFDKQYVYITKWVPEWQELSYVQPIVEHKFARERVLKVFKQGLASF